MQRSLEKKSAREKSMRALKATRPTIHIKDGKLLIAGKWIIIKIILFIIIIDECS